jgi:hypothetical protein
MNTINKILGKDISSIVFKYLTVNKDIIENEYLKTLLYMKNVSLYTSSYREFIWPPSKYKKDFKWFNCAYLWNNDRCVWDLI